eukprot:CAMPEP_0197641820 /NCGR_PEP_ID=MMETSP1338-20131121/15661_1 /TAXON_ID=43686 ORGANISM="Pelagodinium beii, Strain RCC1491" /NCGR_SAMPLE_ID=MMETSP1338 /ASSEMBLY_ACC=CAM_ASM_000754 /LENGTH=114 /DNA_ID=CAMNT_0043214853 /DNA_START=59 /DNA_END=401 /DNA_ORIENTATION=+
MASFMFLGFLSQMKPAYETRVDPATEGKRLKQIWQELETKCFDRYLDEADDDFKGVHPYQKLKKEVSGCKIVLHEDSRRDVLEECTQRIVTLAQQCSGPKREQLMVALENDFLS